MRILKALITFLTVNVIVILAQQYAGNVMVNEPLHPIGPIMENIAFRNENCPLHDNGGKLVMLPNPHDPSKYYVCQNGYAYSFNCGPGLHWNPIALRCDFQAKDNVQPIVGRVVFEYQKHPEDCSKYYQRQLLQCPPGTLWSSKTQRCDFPHLSDCNYGATQQSVSNTPSLPPPQWNPNFNTTMPDAPPVELNDLCSKVGSAYIHYPGDCHRFIQCNGVAFVQTCPSNLFWNSDLSVCDRYCK